MSSLKNYILNLNIFEPPADSNERENAHQRRISIISTRIYIVTLVILLINLGLLSWMNAETTVITLQQPTKSQYETLPNDVQCSCSRISLSYGEFTSLQANFHQVCSSDFISDRWIKALSYGFDFVNRYSTDFRGMANAQFEALAGLCRLSKDSVLQNLDSFYMNTLISPEVLSENVLQSQTEAMIDQFQSTAPNTFKMQLQLLRSTTFDNKLISGLQTNFYFAYFVSDIIGMRVLAESYKPITGPDCNCYRTMNCTALSKIYPEGDQWTSLMDVSGILVGCLPLNSILSSTLECFYDQTCVDKLISFFPTTEKFTAMKLINNSHYELNSTIQSIVDRLMIEEWMKNISYNKYYDQCAPVSCTYTKLEKPNLAYVLTKLISLLSALTLVLGFAIPTTVRFIERPEITGETPSIPLSIRWYQLKLRLKRIILELNIFKQNTLNNDRQMSYQRKATRIYILLIVTSLAILANYTLLRKVIQYETIYNPTESEYIKLDEIYKDHLSCPCTYISMFYSTFIDIEPHFHQICSSDLISSEWLQYITILNEDWNYYFVDYRMNAGSQFQALATFCQQAKQTIDNALNTFRQTQFVSSQVISQQLFESQINSSIQIWKSATINQFLRTIQLIRAITHGNQLMNGNLNTAFNVNSISRKTTITSRTYSDCSCTLSSSCRTTMAIYNYDSSIYLKVYEIPNMYIGCYLVESLLTSTLECFYNRTCMTDIDKYLALPMEESFYFSPLNSSYNLPNETIESIVNRMMIDSWSSNISFTSYYDTCAPSTCTYENIRRPNLFFVITTIIGVLGGLTLGLKIFILIILEFIERLRHRFSRYTFMHFIKTLFNCHDRNRVIRRLHFALVTGLLYILYIVSAFTPHIETTQIQKPTLSIYKDLMIHFPDSLQCPCSKLSIKYQLFLTIKPRFHQVCSSEFISDRWITYLYNKEQFTFRLTRNDFLYSATKQFQLLRSLCQLSQETVNDTLLQLGNSDFINAQLLSETILNDRIQTIINEFQVTMSQLFLSVLSLIRETTAANRIMSVLTTNWNIDTPYIINSEQSAYAVPLIYQGCSCAVSSKCVQPSNGMLVGCYPLEALLQSTFYCLYHQQCIDFNNNFQAINISSIKASRFDINATIESIVNQLMVEEYSSTISYENYFAECAPSSCRYSYIDTSNIVDGITYLISLYGGLSIICKLIAVIIIKLLWRRTSIVNIIEE